MTTNSVIAIIFVYDEKDIVHIIDSVIYILFT